MVPTSKGPFRIRNLCTIERSGPIGGNCLHAAAVREHFGPCARSHNHHLKDLLREEIAGELCQSKLRRVLTKGYGKHDDLNRTCSLFR